MMHWKTLQTTIGAFALGICLTTVVSPLKAAPFSASQEILQSAPKKIFQPLNSKTVGEIHGGNFSISDAEYFGVLQCYIDAKELKRGNTNNNTEKGTLEKTLEALDAHDDIKSQLKKVIAKAYEILGLDKKDNPLGAKTEAEKKILIEKLGKGDLKPKDRYKTQTQLDELFSQQLEKLSKLWGSPQSKNLENPFLVNMMAMKLINILTPYGDKTIDNLLLAHKDRYPFFMFDFIDQSLLKAFNYDKKKDQSSEYKRIIGSFNTSDFQCFAQEKASVITEYMSDQFKGEFEEKLKYWNKKPSTALEKLMETQKEIEDLDIKNQGLKKQLLEQEKYQSKLTEQQKNDIYKALTEVKGLGVGSSLLVAAFSDLYNQTHRETVSFVKNRPAYKEGQTKLEARIQKHTPDPKFQKILKRIHDGEYTFEDLKSFYNYLQKLCVAEKKDLSAALQNRGLGFIIEQLS